MTRTPSGRSSSSSLRWRSSWWWSSSPCPSFSRGNQYWLTVLALLAINILLVSSLRSVTADQRDLVWGRWASRSSAPTAHAILMMKGAPALLAGADPRAGCFAAVIAAAPGVPLPEGEGHLLLDPHPAHRRDLPPGGLLLDRAHRRHRSASWASPGPGPCTLPFVGEIDFDTINNYYYIVDRRRHRSPCSSSIYFERALHQLPVEGHPRRQHAGRRGRHQRHRLQDGELRHRRLHGRHIRRPVRAFQHNLSADATSRFAVYDVASTCWCTWSWAGKTLHRSARGDHGAHRLLAEHTRSMQRVPAACHRRDRHPRHALHARRAGRPPARDPKRGGARRPGAAAPGRGGLRRRPESRPPPPTSREEG